MSVLNRTIFGILCLIVFSQLSLLAQQEERPTASPSMKTFNLAADLVGGGTNSVNLFTGDVALPFNILSLSGRGGLDVDVTINYNSNVKKAVDTWNLEAPAGILGLGWSMDVPKIITDHKNTGAREDDDYYLLDGGTSNKLIRTVSGSDGLGFYYAYALKNHQFWRIKFYSSGNKWEITKEDGKKFIYGDANSSRATVQYLVRWDNWIGHSANATNQSRMAVVWNLSEIVNTWGNKILFEYEQVDQFTGTVSGQKHTEASYLKQITDPVGKKIQFSYLDKDPGFYIEPHTEKSEPDAYQETYEKKYLNTISALDESGIRIVTIQFAYESINQGTNRAKMLLSSITQLNGANESLPSYKFNYFIDGPTKGCLERITLPTGGSVLYTYSRKDIGHAKRDLLIKAPSGFREPKAWFGEDYVVVAWRQMGTTGGHEAGRRDVKLFVYQWVGEWKEQFIETISGVESDGDSDLMMFKDFEVVIQPRFFAVLARNNPSSPNYYSLLLVHKDESKRAGWLTTKRGYDYGTGGAKLLSGENFVAVGSFRDEGPVSHRYVFVGDRWNESVLNQTLGDHYYTAANNYIISHNKAGHDDDPEINFYYLTEDRKWVRKEWGSWLHYISEGKSYWYGSAANALSMASGNPEYIYRWDNTYTNFFRDDVLGGFNDDSFVFNPNGAFAVVNSHPNIRTSTMARFNGSGWIKTANFSPGHHAFASFGIDFILWSQSESGPSTLRTFDANTSLWSDQTLPAKTNTSVAYQSFRAGSNMLNFSDKIYFRKPNGTWSGDFTLNLNAPAGTTLHAPTLKIAGPNYFLYKIYSGLSTSPTVTPYAHFIKNGEVSSRIVIPGDYQYFVLGGSYELFTSNSLITFNGELKDATTLNLHRVLDEQVSGGISDYPVTLITATSYGQTHYTAIDYDVAKAVVDENGALAMYNEVTVIPGSTSVANKPYGYTKTFFHNGLSAPELFTTGVATDLRWKGLSYETQVYNSSGTMIGSSKTIHKGYSKGLRNDNNDLVAVSYYVRPVQVNEMADGIVTITSNTYHPKSGLVTQTATTGAVISQTFFKYFWEAYDTARTLHMLTQTVATRQRLNNQDVRASCTRYRNWASTLNSSGVYAQYDAFEWQGPETDDFSAWDPATSPSADWVFVGQTVSRDPVSGAAIESLGPGGRRSCVILNANKNQSLAVITNCSLANVAATSFEDGSFGNFNSIQGTTTSGNSKTGSKYLALGTTGITKSGLTISETYRVSFWVKTTNGKVVISGKGTISLGTVSEWTPVEYEVTGLSSINIKRSGTAAVLVDEVRIVPKNASIATFTHHPYFGHLSTINNNHQASYTEYDGWGRVKNLFDGDRNIISTYQYNYKN